MNVNEIIRILSDIRSKYNCFDAEDEECYRGLSEAIKMLSAQQWIPCSERLPERNQICIVTDETRRCAYEYGLHDETYDKEIGWTYLGHKIIAWMPLPEPWKGE